MIDVTITLNPIWQRFSVVDLFGSLAAIARFAETLQIPNKASAPPADWFYMVNSKLIEWEFLMTRKAMKIVKLAKVEPLSCSVGAARLGFVSASKRFPAFLGLFALFRLMITHIGYFSAKGLFLFFSLNLTLFGLPVPFSCIFSFPGLSITFLNTFENRRFGIISVSLLALFGAMVSPLVFLALFGLSVILLTAFAFICLTIIALTIPAPSLKTVFIDFLHVKFSRKFSIIASAAFFFFNHLAPFKRIIKPLFGNVRQAPTASDDLTKEGLYSNNNVLVGKKQKSPYAVGSNNYTTNGGIV